MGSMQTIAATKAVKQDGVDIASLIAKDDHTSYAMPEVGDYVNITYPAPPPPPDGTERSTFLRTSGYYTLHLKKDTPVQWETLMDIGFHPGKIVQYSLDKYLEWKHASYAHTDK